MHLKSKYYQRHYPLKQWGDSVNYLLINLFIFCLFYFIYLFIFCDEMPSEVFHGGSAKLEKGV